MGRERFQAEIFVIDASRDRFVQGAPVRVTAKMKDDANEDNIAGDLKAFLSTAESARRAAHAAQDDRSPVPCCERRRGPRRRTWLRLGPTAPSATLRHGQASDAGELKFTLELKEIDWPKTSKLGPGKDARPCASEVDWQKGVGFSWTLEQGGRTIVLNDDKTIPASRNCVSGYRPRRGSRLRPAGRQGHAGRDLGMEHRGFEGDDRCSWP